MDLTLCCVGCGNKFLFTKGEQEFFRGKGLSNHPKRCANCRLTLRLWRKSQNGETVSPVADVDCAECGTLTKVPFEPIGHRPVYCNNCLHLHKEQKIGAVRNEEA